MIAAIYARKSTDQHSVSDDQKSVARQIDHARGFAAAHGWTVGDDVFVDDGISGAEFTNRPGFLRLMNRLKPRAPFQILILSEVSRLGRESIETAYALKQLSVAGVRCWSYLENRELLMESATDKFLLGAVTFAADLEREKARQRTYDAMVRKAHRGHVTGGRLFGYTNHEVRTADGHRSHVERQVHAGEAAIVERIFCLCAEGYGVKAIAHVLNDERAPSPRAQQGRSQTWAPSSVRSVLHQTAYRGVITWNSTRKRDSWGQQHQTDRPVSERVQVPAPQLRIVPEAAWEAAHARLTARRAVYLRGTDGRAFGRPPAGTLSRYLLTSFAVCGRCGSTMKVITQNRAHRRRGRFYGCAGFHDRGRAVCAVGALIPMADADLVLLEAVLDDLLDAALIGEAVDQALGLALGDGDRQRDQTDSRAREIRRLEGERDRLAEAIAAGGELSGLLAALGTREAALTRLRAESVPPATRLDARGVRAELVALAAEWRQVLGTEAVHARPLLARLLQGRVSFTPTGTRDEWVMQGRGTIAGLFTRLVAAIRPLSGTSPTGFAEEWATDFQRTFKAG